MNRIEMNTSITLTQTVTKLVIDFLNKFKILELEKIGKVLLLFDEKSNAHYISCHLKATDFSESTDFNATIDGTDEDELYKLNRDITESENAYLTMVSDAKDGRSFEDIVVEYDDSYNGDFPLKIYGGQHRLRAISNSKSFKPNIYHGFRVYFGLTKEQKIEIATINNTVITVSNDLLDRMKEQLLGSELRVFCQTIGLLTASQDFSDRRDPIIPTVRIARTLIVNYYNGLNSSQNDYHTPLVCKSGGVDEDYIEIRSKVNWTDPNFIEMGQQFVKLNKTQRQKVSSRKSDNHAEFARKAFSLTVVASWSYAAGFYQKKNNLLAILYSLTDNLGENDDPLNSKALSEARLKGIDPDTYRGLGARISADELGRMLEVFFVLVEKASEKKISPKLANAAIQSYEAKKATHNAEKSLSRI